jgi:membrane associated rhomboid family serine protease
VTVLIALIAMNIIVSALAFGAFQNPISPRARRFLFIPHDVARGENGIGMLLSHFSHGSGLHLAFNMIALYSFAGTVLDVLGPAKMLLLYVAAGVGSDLLVFALRKDDPNYRCLGASGSVFGIVMAAVVLRPETTIMLFLLPVPIPGPLFMLGYAVVSIVLIARRHEGGISHEGHLGGAVIGLAVSAVLAPRGLGPLVQWFGKWF